MNNEGVVRAAYARYLTGDIDGLLESFSTELRWTYLDPTDPDPHPQVCVGRNELDKGLRRQSERGLRPQLEEVIASGARVVVVLHTPGLDKYRARPNNDRNFDVLTLEGGNIVALTACHSRADALNDAGISSHPTVT